MKILAVGIATLDIVNYVDHFPAEDAEMRAMDRRCVRGGNATNTLVVLSRLGHSGTWAGTLAADAESRVIQQDLKNNRVDMGGVVRHEGGRTPVSSICVSQATGSRTIVHYRDLPEYTAADFARLDLRAYDWVHFEGREPQETRQMLDRLGGLSRRPRCSVEVEKPREGIESLFHGPDVMLFSRAYAYVRGYDDARRFLRDQRRVSSARHLFCAWGEAGAYALDESGEVIFAPAWRPAEVVDTVAAGDVFNAAVIDGLGRGFTMQQTLRHACRLAGESCACEGLDGFISGGAEGV
ncbi:MAG TPA: ketohexokinase [Chromatiales bacterium]|nr:ketohexokinase [Chromatiales bacterium]